jgi:OOP family OmpA-OmpF porin
MALLPVTLQAQQGEKYTDLRGTSYTKRELNCALFPEDCPAAPGMRTRGLPQQQQGTPQPASVPAKTVVALNVNFETNSDRILPKYHADLNMLGETLVQHPQAQIEIAGHTDDVGSEFYNQGLSQKRAESVKQYLVEKFPNITPERLITQGYGENQPRRPNDSARARSENRRVEAVRVTR